ncbi:MAG: CoA transferase, partial [Gammaproteobacteria bacterium]
HFAGLAEAIGKPELVHDQRFSHSSGRFDNYNELMAIAENWTRQQYTDKADEIFSAAAVPSSPYRTLAASLDDPQLHLREMITTVTDSAGDVTVANAAMLFSETPANIPTWVADVGEHNRAIFDGELNLDAAQLAALDISV